MRPPLVSVIVPTYNRPILLNRTLESIHNQTYSDYEVIVINDAGEPVDEVVSKYHKARLIKHVTNRGLAAARNTGIMHSNGKYICYLDDDDWYYRDHIRVCMDGILAHDARWVYTNTDAYFHQGRKRLYMDVEYQNVDAICHNNMTPVCCVMHEKSLFKITGMFDETLPNHEDWDLWIRFAMVCPPYHIRRTTCCIDRSRQSMTSDIDEMIKGREYIRERYRNRSENFSLLPA